MLLRDTATIVLVGTIPERDAGRVLARELAPIKLKVFRCDLAMWLAHYRTQGWKCWEEEERVRRAG